MTWAWLSPSVVELGSGRRARSRTVWLCADPLAVLGVGPRADPAELRHAYRRLVRLHHPDANPHGELARFQEVTSAYAALVREPELLVEPLAGEWWSLSGFPAREPLLGGSLAVTGITFTAEPDAARPERRLEDEVRISFAGQVFTLALGYSPACWVRLAALAESVALAGLCLALVPLLAALLGLDLFLVSNGSPLVFWGVALASLGAGYGALAAILASAGRSVPTPRGVVRHARAALAGAGAAGERRVDHHG